ncbi:MAG TPA: hypothetical protein VF546_04760 [Pyrinomonadaceae bacterium]
MNGPARALALSFALLVPAHAQTPTQQPTPVPPTSAPTAPAEAAAPASAAAPRAAADLLTRAAATVCAERERDPFGSAAIDEMQARPSLPLLHAEATAGAARAERLLPLAKALTADALRALARDYKLPADTLPPALARLALVRRVQPDVDLRDNASVFYQDPHTIRFGTLFLAGLRSDEGMISVLAHELTHVADGPRATLAPLFRAVALRARATARLRVAGHRAEELTCDLIGVEATRAYVARTPSVEPRPRRAARAVEHNCVARDETDVAHLSPRRTLRAMLALDPAFARELTGDPPPPATAQGLRRPARGRRAAAHAAPR